MRHGVKNNHLGRKTPHRRALLRNLSAQLFQHKRIVTTLAKAKALRVFVEPLITKSKTNTTHQRRLVFSYLNDKEAVRELFDVISLKIANRPGGYCRIIKLDRRVGDAADMAMIELVDFNEIYNPSASVGEEKKKTRRGRPKKAATPKAVAESTTETVVAEAAPVVEEATTNSDVVSDEAIVADDPTEISDNAPEPDAPEASEEKPEA
ncbi:MAG: 50S ribosomal protein L17 [Chitinophagaceae bacterium]